MCIKLDIYVCIPAYKNQNYIKKKGKRSVMVCEEVTEKDVDFVRRTYG